MNALANPHLYAVMFSGASPAGFSLSEADRQHGRYTLVQVVECAARCFAAGRFHTGDAERAAGRFHTGDAELVAHQTWIAVHGLVTLELGGYLVDPYDPASLFESQLVSLMASAGDAVDLAAASVA